MRRFKSFISRAIALSSVQALFLLSVLGLILSVALTSCAFPLPFGSGSEKSDTIEIPSETKPASDESLRPETEAETEPARILSVILPGCESYGYTVFELPDRSTYKSDFTPPTGHDWQDSGRGQAPNCTADGTILEYCTICGDERTVPGEKALGHDYVDMIVPPTCTTSGHTNHVCARCGDTYTDSVVPKTGHTYAGVVTPASCTSEGFTTYTCENCGFSYIGDITEMLPHSYFRTVTAADCTHGGLETDTCEYCGFTYLSATTDPLGHDMETHIISPTKTHDGSVEETCSRCGLTQTTHVLTYSGMLSDISSYKMYNPALGCDLSSHNGDVDFMALRDKGYTFVILKVGSSNGKDASFETNYAKAREAGLPVGAYFYTYAMTVADAEEDANKATDWLDGFVLDYPLFYDMEEPAQESLGAELSTKILCTFMDRMIEEGYFTGIYTNKNWLAGLLDAEKIREGYPVWLASWTSTGQPDKDNSDVCVMWQYATETVEDGVTVSLDLNVVYIDFPEFLKAYGFLV